MWSRFRALPPLLQLLLAAVLVLLIYKVVASSQMPRPDAGAPASQNEDAKNSEVAAYQAEQVQLQARVAQCEAQINQAMQGTAADAVNGIMSNNQPPCEQEMQQWTAREAYLETEIYRLRTGDKEHTVQEITGTIGGSDTPSSTKTSDPDENPAP